MLAITGDVVVREASSSAPRVSSPEVVLAGPQDPLAPVLSVSSARSRRLIADPDSRCWLAGSPQDLALRGQAALVLRDQLVVV